LWSVVNERDELGNDLVPDYLSTVVRGGLLVADDVGHTVWRVRAATAR
jgi:glucose/arabinose dehydrogenase